jgi:hypothetical protein
MADKEQLDARDDGKIEPTIEEPVIESEGEGLQTAVEDTTLPQQSDVNHIDLVEIDSYLKVLVPSVVSMSEVMTGLITKCERITTDLKQRINTIDTSVNRYEKLLAQKNKILQITLASSIGVVLVSLVMVLTAGFNYSRQVNNMNALSVSLAKRLAEVNSGLVTFEQINLSINSLSNSMEQFAMQSETQMGMISAAGLQMQTAMLQSEQLINAGLNSHSDNVNSTIGTLRRENISSAEQIVNAMESIRAQQLEISRMVPAVNDLLAFQNEISALILLERNKYLDALAAEQARRETVFIQPPEEPVRSDILYQRLNE